MHRLKKIHYSQIIVLRGSVIVDRINLFEIYCILTPTFEQTYRATILSSIQDY